MEAQWSKVVNRLLAPIKRFLRSLVHELPNYLEIPYFYKVKQDAYATHTNLSKYGIIIILYYINVFLLGKIEIL